MVNDKINRKGKNMTFVLKTKSSSGSDMVIEYVMSSVTNELKVVDMTVDGKFHHTSYMSPEGVSWLMDLLLDDYSEKVSDDVFNIYAAEKLEESNKKLNKNIEKNKKQITVHKQNEKKLVQLLKSLKEKVEDILFSGTFGGETL